MHTRPTRRQLGSIILYSSAIFALIIGAWNLLVHYCSETNSISKQEDVADLHSGAQHQFVWSDKLQDWALVKEPIQNGHSVEDQQPDIQDCLWPEDRANRHCANSDRIINQLKLNAHHRDEPFKISLANDYSAPIGRELFLRSECPVNECLITANSDEADAIVFPNSDVLPPGPSSRGQRINQIWVAYLLESPPNTFDQRFVRKHRGQHIFNWTASYRSNSDIVTPYAKFVPYLDQKQASSSPSHAEQHPHSYALASEKHRALIRNKRNKVAWFVSNCHAKNGRLEFAKTLAKFIQVDIYGKCGNLTCNKWSQAECLELLNRDYKFYLAFENSNNREYITEKLYQNALGFNDRNHLLVPIVMGPSRSDYERLAPPGSFIHVDDFESVEALASYLKLLAGDDELYYSYFKWKTMGEFIDTKFMCRLCAMLHESHRSQRIKMVSNLRDWWLDDEIEKWNDERDAR